MRAGYPYCGIYYENLLTDKEFSIRKRGCGDVGLSKLLQ